MERCIEGKIQRHLEGGDRKRHIEGETDIERGGETYRGEDTKTPRGGRQKETYRGGDRHREGERRIEGEIQRHLEGETDRDIERGRYKDT